MTNPTNTMMAGPESSAISPRLRQSGFCRRVDRGAGAAAVAAPPAPAEEPSGRDDFRASAFSPEESVMTCLAPGRRAVHGLDDAGGVALAGEELDHAGVEGVADVLAEQRVQPDHDVRGFVVGLEDVLERALLDDPLGLLARGQRVERLRVGLLVLLLHEEVEERGALLHRGRGRAGVAVDTTHHRGRVARAALDGREREPAEVSERLLVWCEGSDDTGVPGKIGRAHV